MTKKKYLKILKDSFKDFKFYEDGHYYECKGKRVGISVTTFIHEFCNEFDAEEIMQDAILKAFNNIDIFTGTEKDFVAFVKKIAVNKSIDWYRKHNKEPFFDDIDDVAVSSQPSTVGESEDETEYSLEQIMDKIELLPIGYKMVLKLHLIDELDFSEIAETMNIKTSTVRSQFVRAKERLKKLLENN